MSVIIKNGNYTVYFHINKINGKIYVGITCRNPNKRWSNGNGYKYKSKFWNAIKKYGWNNFEHEIFATKLTKAEACNMEKLLIKKLHTTDDRYGYNMDEGGGLPPVLKGEKNPFYGRHDIVGEKHPFYGKHHSEETRKKMSQHHWDSSGANNPFFGKHVYANGNSVLCKPVQCVETGIVYFGVTEAERQTHIARQSIRKAASGKISHAGGYHWIYLNEQIPCAS